MVDGLFVGKLESQLGQRLVSGFLGSAGQKSSAEKMRLNLRPDTLKSKLTWSGGVILLDSIGDGLFTSGF